MTPRIKLLKPFELLIFYTTLINASLAQPTSSFTSFYELKERLYNIEHNPDSIISIVELDVLSHYKLNEYDTELKRKVFSQSPEYAQKLKSLSTLRQKTIITPVYIVLDRPEISNYNIKNKSISIFIGSNYQIDWTKMVARPPHSIAIKKVEMVRHDSWGYQVQPIFYQFQSNVFTIKKTEEHFTKQPVDYYYLNVPLSQEEGLIVENNFGNLNVVVLFRPETTKNVTFNFLYSNLDTFRWYKATQKAIASSSFEILFIHEATNEILVKKHVRNLQKKPNTAPRVN
jgi:hypothetical protein